MGGLCLIWSIVVQVYDGRSFQVLSRFPVEEVTIVERWTTIHAHAQGHATWTSLFQQVNHLLVKCDVQLDGGRPAIYNGLSRGQSAPTWHTNLLLRAQKDPA